MNILLLSPYLSLLWHFNVATIDVSRSSKGDVMTSERCTIDGCRRIGGDCIDGKRCQCKHDLSTYVRHVNRCIPNSNLTKTLFREKGCSYRLVPNSYQNSKPRGSEPCAFEKLRLHALDPKISGSQLIDICGIFTWSVSSCEVMSGAYYDYGNWKDIWHAGSNQTTFSVVKKLGVALYLKWNNTLPSRYYGYIISLDVRCKRKFNRTNIESCLLFKVERTKTTEETDLRTSTSPPRNYTGNPMSDKTQPSPLKNGQRSSNDTTMIVIGVVGGLFVFILLFMIVWCLKKRRNLFIQCINGKHKKRSQESTRNSSPMSDMNQYQSVHQNEPPVYTTPAKTNGYQDLVFTKNTYQSLVHNTSGDVPPPSPIYHLVKEPGDTSNDLTDHEYQVLEGPS